MSFFVLKGGGIVGVRAGVKRQCFVKYVFCSKGLFGLLFESVIFGMLILSKHVIKGVAMVPHTSPHG